jgi:hypothetical protein
MVPLPPVSERAAAPRSATGGAVLRSSPPQSLVDAINPVVRWLASSSLHHLVDPFLLVLHVAGRRTKRHYAIPVGYVRLDERLLIVTQRAWRANLRGGADIEVTLGGTRRPVRASLDEAPESVAATFGKVIDRLGWPKARRRLGIRTKTGEPPSAAELVEGVREHNLAIVSLVPNPGRPLRISTRGVSSRAESPSWRRPTSI